EAFVLTSTDYYAYGMAMPERSTSPGSYRYGYNGMEREETWNAEVGDYYTTEFRMLDVRIGRWLSLDPLAGQFPWQSPFAAAVFLPGNRTGPALAAAMESLVDQVDILLKDKEVNLHSTIYKFNSESIFGMAKDGLVYMASPLYNKFYAESFPSMMVEMRNSLWGPRK
ncbi:MAG: hypothetical protein JNM00_05570, partial [Flavobacteriales bacterium]|nr:hypothetical protein [Flavobacteriales bacterium]